jgi:hypothetical protein
MISGKINQTNWGEKEIEGKLYKANIHTNDICNKIK